MSGGKEIETECDRIPPNYDIVSERLELHLFNIFRSPEPPCPASRDQNDPLRPRIPIRVARKMAAEGYLDTQHNVPLEVIIVEDKELTRRRIYLLFLRTLNPRFSALDLDLFTGTLVPIYQLRDDGG